MKVLLLFAVAIVCFGFFFYTIVPKHTPDPGAQAHTSATANQANQAIPTARFQPVTNAYPIGAHIALDTVTGQLCRTWDWVYLNKLVSGYEAPDSLPLCVEIYRNSHADPTTTAAPIDYDALAAKYGGRPTAAAKKQYLDDNGNPIAAPTDWLTVSPVPAIGAVENGYKFKGGNPAQKSSWEKVTVTPPFNPHAPYKVIRP